MKVAILLRSSFNFSANPLAKSPHMMIETVLLAVIKLAMITKKNKTVKNIYTSIINLIFSIFLIDRC
jgi:hypothetical protein